jgi:hypothetical protein
MSKIKDVGNSVRIYDNTDTQRLSIPDTPAATIVQTYSTAASTLAAQTSSATVAGLTLAAVTVGASAYGYDSQTQANAITAQIKKLVADDANTMKVLNKVVDALQSAGLLG